jgi:hypothetical protein
MAKLLLGSKTMLRSIDPALSRTITPVKKVQFDRIEYQPLTDVVDEKSVILRVIRFRCLADIYLCRSPMDSILANTTRFVLMYTQPM